MSLFNKLFRGAPRIGLSNEDRGVFEDTMNESGVSTKGRVDAARKLLRSGVNHGFI